MGYPETQCSEYNIDDVVPYINRRGNIAKCKIKSFHDVGNGTVWFKGFDIKTLADVFYPVRKSIGLAKAIDNTKNHETN